MHNSEKPKFLEFIVSIGEYFNTKLSNSTIDIYFNGLVSYDFEAIKDAGSRYIQMPESKFMPKVADFINMIDGSTKDSALNAWTSLVAAIRLAGPWRSIVSDDPVLLRVVDDMGGWIELCKTSNDDLPFKANEFTTRYRGYKSVNLTDYPRKLIGYEDQNNHEVLGGEFKPSKPHVIGDVQKALEV
ncbi:MAG: DUF6475 domain-containing protein, partial [Pseudomonadota bacterium]